ncbi:MAG: LPS export ABC transporter periplasmic protein LptC [Desulfopila sp.]
MIKRRNYIWLAPLALLVTFPLWRQPVGMFLAPRIPQESPRKAVDNKRQNFTMQTVRILQSKNGEVSTEIRATRAFTTDTPDEYRLEMVDADLYNARGEPTNITAEQGVYNGTSQQLTLIDNVVIFKQSNEQRLFTDLLYYDEGKQLVYCPNATRLVGKDVEIAGTGLTYQMALGTYELGGRVHCLLQGSITP